MLFARLSLGTSSLRAYWALALPIGRFQGPLAALGFQPPDVEIAATAFTAYHTLRNNTRGRPGCAPNVDDEHGVEESNYQIRVLITVRAAARCHGLSARLCTSSTA
jgi:hypothetical protein